MDNLNATTNGNVAGESTEAKTEQDVKGRIVELLFQLERNGRKPGTIEGYNKLFRSALKNNVNLLDPEDVKAFLARVKWADSTKANAVAMLEVWFRSLNIRWSQPTYEAEAEIPFLPTEAELDSLISGSGKKMSAYLQLLKETGGRAGEIANLTWTDIDTQQKTVRIKPEKGSYPRILPLTTKALDMVNNLQKYTQKRKQHIFANADDMRANFYTQRKHIAEKLGNPRLLEVHFHTFRHWKGTTEYHKTKDAFWVKEILGHKNILSTQVYIHIEKAKYPKGASDDFFSKVASTKEEIQELLDSGFEYVLQKDGLAFFRKRK